MSVVHAPPKTIAHGVGSYQEIAQWGMPTASSRRSPPLWAMPSPWEPTPVGDGRGTRPQKTIAHGVGSYLGIAQRGGFLQKDA